MPGLLIIAHDPLASTMKAVGKHPYPDYSGAFEAVDVASDLKADEIEAVEARAREALQRVRSPEALILTDVVGATPCNLALRLADGVQVRVVAGLNVSMLWRVLCYGEDSLDAMVARAVSGAVQGVMPLASSRPQNQAFRPGANDQEQRHHQQ